MEYINQTVSSSKTKRKTIQEEIENLRENEKETENELKQIRRRLDYNQRLISEVDKIIASAESTQTHTTRFNLLCQELEPLGYDLIRSAVRSSEIYLAC